MLANILHVKYSSVRGKTPLQKKKKKKIEHLKIAFPTGQQCEHAVFQSKCHWGEEFTHHKLHHTPQKTKIPISTGPSKLTQYYKRIRPDIKSEKESLMF